MASIGTRVVEANAQAQAKADEKGEPFAVVTFAGDVLVLPARKVVRYLMSHPAATAWDYYYPQGA